MKILFICRGNKKFTISPIIRAQADSLIAKGYQVDIYPISGKGLSSYIKNLFGIIKKQKGANYSIIHAHYGFSAIACSLVVQPKKLVVSLMGSELHLSSTIRYLFVFLVKYIWRRVIVKTKGMSEILKTSKVSILPNGVNLDIFYPVQKEEARNKLGIFNDKRIILFPSYPFRKEKNYPFAKRVCERLDNVELLHFSGYTMERVNLLYNAAEVVILLSDFEGSPNVIKEAMACNRPIVSTDVGDVKWVIDGVAGCYLSTLEEESLIEKIELALNFSEKYKKTNGRQRIVELDLSSDKVADKLLEIYRSN